MLLFLHIFYFILEVKCGYPPIGDEVQAGSVLLPASRRGRYLANIVRRQAVDGTGIKFNKDADRMNAEAKKKVDVLSEELLPYIIAEQERRTTLYKRVMTAIQNGEKGVTIAEIRNKPPAIIRKGLMYRCPSNRAPKEPDGSGSIMCDDEIEPTPIMYDSCLSAEDKELYVAENKYFFCNRHKVEGPDLPRNGTTVIGCAPCERTSLNYTSAKCALEDTDDVVVHYRYYPDRVYKFVTELDPDREVCDHWNPCQVGYIFSLPSLDQATPASELWHDEDSTLESVKISEDYTSSYMAVKIPPGLKFDGISMIKRLSKRLGAVSDTKGSKINNIEVAFEEIGDTVKVRMIFRPVQQEDVSGYFARFINASDPHSKLPKYVKIMEFEEADVQIYPIVLEAVPSQKINETQINMTCDHCECKVLMVRGIDGAVRNLDNSQFRILKINDDISSLAIELEVITFQNFGDYFALLTLPNGNEQRSKVLTIKLLKIHRIDVAGTIGERFENEVLSECIECDIIEVLCRGESTLGTHVTLVKRATQTLHFNFVSFEDANACVYIAIFKHNGEFYQRTVAVIENDAVTIDGGVQSEKDLKEGVRFEKEVKYTCTGGDCNVNTVSLAGVNILANTRRTNIGSIPFYVLGDNSIILRITEYTPLLAGVYQAIFTVDGDPITKTLFEIGLNGVSGGPGSGVSVSGGSESGGLESGGSTSAESGTGGSGAEDITTTNPGPPALTNSETPDGANPDSTTEPAPDAGDGR